MYAYIDETGNTGQNLFDPTQPVFMTAALIGRKNFDVVYKERIRALASRAGNEIIHANVLGMAGLEEIAGDIQLILKESDAKFFVARVDKLYLATAKMVDTIFDSGENQAVPWHSYNVRPLRLLLVFKVAYLLDQNIVKKFWSCLMQRKKDKAYEEFNEVLNKLLYRVDALPDKRSRELISEAVKWAIDNPEAIYLHSNSAATRYGHLPNLAVFPELLGGIEERSRLWRRPVKKLFTIDRVNLALC